MEYTHKCFLVDGNLTPNKTINIKGTIIIYEVVRVIDSIPLFFENHIQRLNISARRLNKHIPLSNHKFAELLEKLIISNQVFTGNVKITLEYTDNSEIKQSVIGFIPHRYPSAEEYSNGVKTISSIDQRLNPDVKVQNDDLRNKLNQLMQSEEAFEAILIHPDGYFTEGSRSNIFFVQGNTVITSPDEEVLGGITRYYTIRICKENNIEIRFESLPYLSLRNIDAAFLTGTSPKILPISRIDNNEFKLPNPFIQKISDKYNELILSYIASHQKNSKARQ